MIERTLLRSAAAVAAVAGALGSFVLMLRAGGRAPLYLIAAFVAWVVASFALSAGPASSPPAGRRVPATPSAGPRSSSPRSRWPSTPA